MLSQFIEYNTQHLSNNKNVKQLFGYLFIFTLI